MRSGSGSGRKHALDVAFVLAVIALAGPSDAAPKPATTTPRPLPRQANAPPRPIAFAPQADAPRPVSWAASLPAIEVKNRNTNAHATIRLYHPASGSLDRAALRTFMRVACSIPDVPPSGDHDARPDGDLREPLHPRLVQLVFRAAYHFHSTSMVIVSATRKGDHGKHGAGEALDFKLVGVRASSLAAYARGFPRAGVGIYEHPETQYVHVDARDRSWHWADGSAPGVSTPERVLPDPTQAQRDASYVPAMDLPEGARAH
jgi:hypothetical protein